MAVPGLHGRIDQRGQELPVGQSAAPDYVALLSQNHTLLHTGSAAKRTNDSNQLMTPTDDRFTRVSRRRLLKATPFAIGALGMTGTAAATGAGVTTQSTDVFGQGPNGPVVAADGATIRRTANGVSLQLAMPTPEPGTYVYPNPSPTATDEAGSPEAFTLWGFVWNDPSAADWDGAFLVAGHGVAGPHLTFSGTISTATDPFAGEALDNPDGAEVHLAVAPHGAVDPDLLPGQLQTPSGPGPDIWWLAVFEPPA